MFCLPYAAAVRSVLFVFFDLQKFRVHIAHFAHSVLSTITEINAHAQPTIREQTANGRSRSQPLASYPSSVCCLKQSRLMRARASVYACVCVCLAIDNDYLSNIRNVTVVMDYRFLYCNLLHTDKADKDSPLLITI